MPGTTVFTRSFITMPVRRGASDRKSTRLNSSHGYISYAVFCLKKNSPEVTRKLWEREESYQAIRRYYDEIFIYCCQQLFATSSHYGLHGEIAPMVRYCGYVSTS